ncbi:alpha/beta fold hydrolase [Streptomyces sp. DSM 44917]|uniref:Alpha/beta fold hydrolase n=1 Tax=Streptomyces boetiae TaxID=3075541 RepID=A0ABU2L7Z5_9ACTN|nr:alpha/beta fold hydrolase [Streptomyces sp. DSM 44917]MDT0307689.1 alpha/beta fold hydrolase [Streptomyces sp. DSM 44917]
MSRPPFCVPPAGVRAHRLATRRGEFAVLDAGPAPGIPCAGTALLVPGYTGSKEDFIALLRPLAAAGFRAVAVDGRGQYETLGPGSRAAYGLGALAEDVLAQGEALAGGGPVHLTGHSLGGLIARGAVLRAMAAGTLPAPFASLTLMASGPARVARFQRWRVRLLVATLPVLGPSAVWRMWNPRPEAGEIGAFLRTRWLAHTPQQLLATGRTLRHEPDRVARLAAAGLPVHVLSGERDGAWPVPLLDRMARRLNARRTVIRDAEHSPNAEQPEATAAALTDFWLTATSRPAPAGRRTAAPA